MKKTILNLAILGSLVVASNAVMAVDANCIGLPSQSQLHDQLVAAKNIAGGNGGFGLNMWGTVVNRDGIVCAVAFTGADRGDQWPGSRVISAQKANTANSFSLPSLVLSTANLYTAVQAGGTLFGLQESNPVDVTTAYQGPSSDYGTESDPLVDNKVGGVNVFGGGLALYDNTGKLVGAIGVSGDSSCADHNIAWETRHGLGFDFVPGGVNVDPLRPDNIIYDIKSQEGQMPGISKSGWGHPICSTTAKLISKTLPVVSIVSK